MGWAGWCVFRIWAIGTFWSFRPLWTWWRWTASSAATPRGAGWPTVTPLPSNQRGQISVRYYTNPVWCSTSWLNPTRCGKPPTVYLTSPSWLACPPSPFPSSSLLTEHQLSPSLSFPSLSPAQVSPFLFPTGEEDKKWPQFWFSIPVFDISIVKSTGPDSIPFVVVCPCSVPPALEYSAHASWAFSQTQAHPGTSWP